MRVLIVLIDGKGVLSKFFRFIYNYASSHYFVEWGKLHYLKNMP